MVMKHQVELIARTHLYDVFKDYKGALRTVMDSFTFQRWAELCRDRCNQLNNEGYMRNRKAFHQFVKDAANAYAHARLNPNQDAATVTNINKLIRCKTDCDI